VTSCCRFFRGLYRVPSRCFFVTLRPPLFFPFPPVPLAPLEVPPFFFFPFFLAPFPSVVFLCIFSARGYVLEFLCFSVMLILFSFHPAFYINFCAPSGARALCSRSTRRALKSERCDCCKRSGLSFFFASFLILRSLGPPPLLPPFFFSW